MLDKNQFNLPIRLDREAPISIAVVRLSAMGDILLMIPTIERIQRHFHQAQITWIISRPLAPLVKHLKGITVLAIDKPDSLRDYWQTWKLLRKYSFDVLLAMQASFRINCLYPMIRAPIKVGFDKARSNDGHHLFINHRIKRGNDHLAEGFMRFAEALGVVPSPPKWCMPADPDCVKTVQGHLQDWESTYHPKNHGSRGNNSREKGQTVRWIAINPAASKAERTCDAEFYAALIQALHHFFLTHSPSPWAIVLTGGPSTWEQQLAATICQHSTPRPLNMVGKTNLLELAALLNHCDCVIAPDTGPAHLANAMQTDVIGLYAVAPPGLSGPYDSRHWIIDKYPQAVETFLQKKTTDVPWGTRVHEPGAMQLIRVEDVMEQVNAWFKARELDTLTTC